MEEVRTATPRCGMGGLVNEIVTVRVSDMRSLICHPRWSSCGRDVRALLIVFMCSMAVSITRETCCRPDWGFTHDAKPDGVIGNIKVNNQDSGPVRACQHSLP